MGEGGKKEKVLWGSLKEGTPLLLQTIVAPKRHRCECSRLRGGDSLIHLLSRCKCGEEFEEFVMHSPEARKIKRKKTERGGNKRPVWIPGRSEGTPRDSRLRSVSPYTKRQTPCRQVNVTKDKLSKEEEGKEPEWTARKKRGSKLFQYERGE